MTNDSERLENGFIKAQAIIEIVGKPKEHIVEVLESHIKQIDEDSEMEIIEKVMEEPLEQEEQPGVFSTFVELTFWAKKMNKLIAFCFDYMPSSIEIIAPESMITKSHDLTSLLNDMQARLHHVDMLAKQLHQQNQVFNLSLNRLARNLIMMAVSIKPLNEEKLIKTTGIKKENLVPFLKNMIEEKRISEKDGLYSLVKDGDTKQN